MTMNRPRPSRINYIGLVFSCQNLFLLSFYETVYSRIMGKLRTRLKDTFVTKMARFLDIRSPSSRPLRRGHVERMKYIAIFINRCAAQAQIHRPAWPL